MSNTDPTPQDDPATGEVTREQRSKEKSRIGHRPHIEGIARGTMIEYDDWQWAVVTEIYEDEDPTMVGFVLVDALDDDIVQLLESAWGCWEHYDIIKPFRGEYEYYTNIDYLTGDDIWTVLGPIHPDARENEQEAAYAE